MAITPGSDIETKTSEPLPKGFVQFLPEFIRRPVMNYFNGKDRLAGEIVSGINRNRQNIVQLETDYQAADGAISTAYIAADAVVAADATSARAALYTTITSEYTAVTDGIEGDVATNSAAITSEASTRASADSAIASDVTALEARVTTTEGDISTNAAAITTEATARASGDSANATSIETLEAYVAGPNPNLVPNSNFELDDEGWTLVYGSAVNNVNGTYWNATAPASGTTVMGYSPFFTAVDTGTYSFSYEQSPTIAGSGKIRCDLECWDASTRLSREGLVTSSDASWTRVKSEGISSIPSGTVKMRLRWYFNSADSGDQLRIRRVKVERNATATAYTSDQGEYAAGAYVKTLKEAFVDTDGNAIAQFVVEASAGGGDPARIGLRDGSGGSSIALVAEQIFFGSDTVFEDTYNTIYTESGGYRLRILGPFPASGDLVIWYGADSVALNSETKTNGVFALATDGKVYMGSTSTADSAVTTGIDTFSNESTSGTTWVTIGQVDLGVGSGGYYEFPGSLFTVAGLVFSSGTYFYGEWRITEQLQSGGTVHVLASGNFDADGTSFPPTETYFDPDISSQGPVSQNLSGSVRLRLQIRRRSGSNNLTGGVTGKFAARRTP